MVESQFLERLKDHRRQVSGRRAKSDRESEALAADRLLHPRSTHNHKGELVFAMTPAAGLLREDVCNGLHKQLSSEELQAKREEYAPVKHRIFYNRRFQEVRYQKRCKHLEAERIKAQEKRLAQFEKEKKKLANK